MKIRVETHGHQHYTTLEGEVLAWVQATDHYHDQQMNLQVPAVLLKCGKDVKLVLLQGYLRWTTVKVLEE